MALTQKETDDIIKFVKQEPRTIQDISKLIGRSWVTTDSYAAQIKERTGLVNIKTFRKGSQGALKIAFYNHKESSVGDDVKEELLSHIKMSRDKKDFDFFEVFQFIPDDKKKAFYEEYKDEDVSTK